MRCKNSWVFIACLLSACSNNEKSQVQDGFTVQPGKFLLVPSNRSEALTGDFATNPRAAAFINHMVNHYGFERAQLNNWLSQTHRSDYVLRLMNRQSPNYTPPTGPTGAWLRYRKKFITADNIDNGVAFWNKYAADLKRAEKQYGVPAEIIVGIIGVETRWGRVMGNTRIIDALATLAFDYPRRADYFSRELEIFLLMSRHEQDNPLALRGSFAGAMGYGQFMPSAYQQYAVDFNGDGHANLWDPVDAIGSVAHYFQKHGWQSGEPVAVMASGDTSELKHGFQTRYTVNKLQQFGLTPQQALADDQLVSLLRLDVGNRYQYWYGLRNFYVITRYNHSTYYAMTIWQLGEAVKSARK